MDEKNEHRCLTEYLNLKDKRERRNQIKKLRSNEEVRGNQEMTRSQKLKEETFSRKKKLSNSAAMWKKLKYKKDLLDLTIMSLCWLFHWDITDMHIYQFQVYNTMTWYLYMCEMITTSSLVNVLTFERTIHQRGGEARHMTGGCERMVRKGWQINSDNFWRNLEISKKKK